MKLGEFRPRYYIAVRTPVVSMPFYGMVGLDF